MASDLASASYHATEAVTRRMDAVEDAWRALLDLLSAQERRLDELQDVSDVLAQFRVISEVLEGLGAPTATSTSAERLKELLPTMEKELAALETTVDRLGARTAHLPEDSAVRRALLQVQEKQAQAKDFLARKRQELQDNLLYERLHADLEEVNKLFKVIVHGKRKIFLHP